MGLIVHLDNDSTAVRHETIPQVGVHRVFIFFTQGALCHCARTNIIMLFKGFNSFWRVYIDEAAVVMHPALTFTTRSAISVSGYVPVKLVGDDACGIGNASDFINMTLQNAINVTVRASGGDILVPDERVIRPRSGAHFQGRPGRRQQSFEPPAKSIPGGAPPELIHVPTDVIIVLLDAPAP